MFPRSGSGSVMTSPVCRPRHQPVPEVFYPSGEACVKYQLFKILNENGECYCEVSLEGGDQIDLVWLESDSTGEVQRTVGIEIKTASEFNRATHKLETQIEGYRNCSFNNINHSNYICGDDVINSSDAYFFDQVWIVTTIERDRWTLPWRDDTPEDGWLHYNKFTGQIKYEIDPPTDRETAPIDFDQHVSEAQLTAALWGRYQSSQTVLGAESWFSQPFDRLLKEGKIKYKAGKGNGGKTKRADLVVGKLDDINPLTEDATIRALEVKTSFNASIKAQLREQLDLYCNSTMFSEVYLAIPDSLTEKAQPFLEKEYPQVGLLTVNIPRDDISLQKESGQFDLQKIPVVNSIPGNEHYFDL